MALIIHLQTWGSHSIVKYCYIQYHQINLLKSWNSQKNSAKFHLPFKFNQMSAEKLQMSDKAQKIFWEAWGKWYCKKKEPSKNCQMPPHFLKNSQSSPWWISPRCRGIPINFQSNRHWCPSLFDQTLHQKAFNWFSTHFLFTLCRLPGCSVKVSVPVQLAGAAGAQARVSDRAPGAQTPLHGGLNLVTLWIKEPF